MPFTLEDVSICIFDANATVAPHTSVSDDHFTNTFKFLYGPDAYRKQHDLHVAGNMKIDTTHLISGKPLELTKFNKFWESYGQLSHGSEYDAWKLQMPFICFPKNRDIGLNSSTKLQALEVTQRIYLNALGWSTQIVIRLRGSIDIDDLTTFVGELRSSSLDNPPLTSTISKTDSSGKVSSQKEQTTLSGIFKNTREMILKDVYADGKVSSPTPTIHRFFVISINAGKNMYGSNIYSYANWPMLHQGQIRGVLFGKSFDAASEAQAKNTQRLLHTMHNTDGAFILTNFDHGAIIFLQEFAKFGPPDKRTHCHDMNLRAFFRTVLSLWSFYRIAELSADNPRVMALRSLVASDLRRIRATYTTPVSQEVFKKHEGLYKLLEPPTAP